MININNKSSLSQIKTSLNSITVINLSKITEQELHTMVNDINRNFNILINSAIGKGPSGISPELKLLNLQSGTSLTTKYFNNITSEYIKVDTSNDIELNEWQGGIEEQQYQAMPIYTQIFKDVVDIEAYNGIISKNNNNEFIGDFSGWLYQSGLNINNEPVYNIIDAFPKLYKNITQSGDIKYTWIINGKDTGINAEGQRGHDGLNANIFATSVPPTSESFPYQNNVKVGDILFAPTTKIILAKDETTPFYIWKYETDITTGISNWKQIINLTTYFPQVTGAGAGATFENQYIRPAVVETNFIKLNTNINNINSKSGLSFNYPVNGLNIDGSNILCLYRFGISEENAIENSNIIAQYLTLKLDRSYKTLNGGVEEVIDFNFIPGLKFDNSINVFNLHMGDNKIDFAPYTPNQIKYIQEGDNIYGSSDIKHLPYEIYLNTDIISGNRYFTIKDYQQDINKKTIIKNRSFIHWKVLK